MSRQLRTLSAGSSVAEVSAVAASSTSLVISNYGYTNISSTAAAEWTLAPPDAGIRKVLYSTSTTSAARVVRGSTAATVTFTNQGATQITFNATADQAIELMGINSTQWVVLGMYPGTAVNSTGIVVGTS